MLLWVIIFTFQVLGWTKLSKLIENSELKSRSLFGLIFQFYLMYRLIFQRPVHLLSAQIASVSTLFQMFIVLWMYDFESIKKKREFLLWPASESRFLCQHLSTANPIHSCKLCSIKSFNAHFASHQCLMVYGKRERKANKWLYEKRNVKMINGILLPKFFGNRMLFNLFLEDIIN